MLPISTSRCASSILRNIAPTLFRSWRCPLDGGSWQTANISMSGMTTHWRETASEPGAAP